eukprot:3254569-Pyramimonas_sp.AAC.1
MPRARLVGDRPAGPAVAVAGLTPERPRAPRSRSPLPSGTYASDRMAHPSCARLAAMARGLKGSETAGEQTTCWVPCFDLLATVPSNLGP